MESVSNSINQISGIFEEEKEKIDTEILVYKRKRERKPDLLNKINYSIQLILLESSSSKLGRIDQSLTTFNGVIDDVLNIKQKDLNTLGELKTLLGEKFEPVQAAITLDQKKFIESKKKRLQASYFDLFKNINEVKKDSCISLSSLTVDNLIKEINTLYNSYMESLNNAETQKIVDTPIDLTFNKSELNASFDEYEKTRNGEEKSKISFKEAYPKIKAKLICEYMLTLLNKIKLYRIYELSNDELDKLRAVIKSELRSIDIYLKSINLSEMFEVKRVKTEEEARVIQDIRDTINTTSGYYEQDKIEPDDLGNIIRK